MVPSGRLQFLLRLASQRRDNTVETKFLTLPALNFFMALLCHILRFISIYTKSIRNQINQLN